MNMDIATWIVACDVEFGVDGAFDEEARASMLAKWIEAKLLILMGG